MVPTDQTRKLLGEPGIVDALVRRASVSGELIRYGVTAIVALAADLIGFQVAVHGLGWDVRIGAGVGFAIGLVVNYVLSTRWVFRQRAVTNRSWEFVIFAAIGVFGLGMTLLIVETLHVRFGVWELIAKGVAVVIVFGWNFLARKICLFAAPPRIVAIPPDSAAWPTVRPASESSLI